ncbi:hypothetical protein CTheo_7565 [Ceratobasidium theobromae]|uniref:Uncharacterized protein n=1 Tax=Ceratobasidium theobromae TaxID=1582974 RepID=A0A5N5QBF2_9AGAM|nr:hypothetical protein CTheo_7565 [Ceratobasidium theobromae]
MDDSTLGAAGKLFGNWTRRLGEDDEDELTDGLEDEVKEAEEDKASGQGVKPEVDPISPVEDERDAQVVTQPNGYGLSSKPPTAIGSPLVPTPQVLRDHVRTPSPNLTSTTGS